MTFKELEEMIAGERTRLIEAGQPVTVEALTGKTLPFVAVDRKLAAYLMFIGLEVFVNENLLALSASAGQRHPSRSLSDRVQPGEQNNTDDADEQYGKGE